MPDGRNRLYGDLAHLWPLMSPPEDYADEAVYWRDALREGLGAPEGIASRPRVLELGCGGGHLLSHLAGEVDATAVDLSKGMLAHARRLCPGVALHQGDMRTIRLGETFDAVLIHDAIDYMLTEDDLRAVFATARAHLRPGGLLLLAPDHYTDTFAPDAPVVTSETNSDATTTLTWIECDVMADPGTGALETVYVFCIVEGGQVRVEVDRHTTGLFAVAVWERLLAEAGFAARRTDYPVSEDGTAMYLWVCRLEEGAA